MTNKTDSKEREFTMSQYASTADMICAMRERIEELETQLASIGAGGVNGSLMGRAFDAADMATASAQGFRDGVASLAASAGSEPVESNRPSLESVFRGLSDRAYCNYIEQMRRNECLGWEHKVKHGTFGEAELKAHTLAGRLLGRHHAFAEAANALRGSDAPLTHPSPPEGMVMVPLKATNSITCAIENEVDSQLVASAMDPRLMHRQDGSDVWDAAIAAVIAPPTTSAGSKGE